MTKPAHVWDIENFNATYAYTDYEHHDFTTLNDLEKTYKVALAYNYNNQPKYYSPFNKIIRNNLLALFRDFNYSLLPSRLNFQISFDRFYSENTLRKTTRIIILPYPLHLIRALISPGYMASAGTYPNHCKWILMPPTYR